MNSSEIYLKIGLRVSYYRRLQGWTQEQLSNVSKVSRARISDIECGKGNFYFDSILAIADALGKDYRLLLYGDELIEETIERVIKRMQTEYGKKTMISKNKHICQIFSTAQKLFIVYNII